MSENKVKRSDKRKERVWPVLVCLILAMALFFLLLNVEKRQMENFEKGYVLVAIQDVVDDTEITPENVAQYLALEARTLTDIPKAAYMDMEAVIGLYAEGAIDQGSMITKSMFGSLGDLGADEVLLSVDMEALDQSVAGTLRAGDRIDLYAIEKEADKEVTVDEILGSVVIERSYTGSGVSIQKEDSTSIARYITIPVHEDAVEAFYEVLENKKIQVVKHPQ